MSTAPGAILVDICIRGLGAIGIALLTVSYQAIAAALMNPVKSLKTSKESHRHSKFGSYSFQKLECLCSSADNFCTISDTDF
ncbi:MAG: hypothetical protein R2822_03445 [Spirosomataceae bacterium]